MSSSKKSLLVVNGLCWLVALLLHPLSNLLPTNSGETPKFYSLPIPLIRAFLVWLVIIAAETFAAFCGAY